MKLLIVDDQSTVVQGLLHCTNWAAMGFTVVDTALNAVDAKASLLRQEAEVMLCDIEMPMESGLDLLDWLRQRGMTTRCIFLTAHAEFRYAQEALRLGGFDYIMQPAPLRAGGGCSEPCAGKCKGGTGGAGAAEQGCCF